MSDFNKKKKDPTFSMTVEGKSGAYYIDLSCTYEEYCDVTKKEYNGNKASKGRDFKKLPKTGKIYAQSKEPNSSDGFDWVKAKPEQVTRALRILKNRKIVEPYSEYKDAFSKEKYNI